MDAAQRIREILAEHGRVNLDDLDMVVDQILDVVDPQVSQGLGWLSTGRVFPTYRTGI